MTQDWPRTEYWVYASGEIKHKGIAIDMFSKESPVARIILQGDDIIINRISEDAVGELVKVIYA